MTLWSGRVAGELAPEVWEFLRADDDELLPYDVQGTLLHAERLSMERSATAFTAADRIGQLAVQINDIADTRAMLERQGHVPL